MKYNRREIMKAAWYKHRMFGMEFSAALRLAWYDAKAAAPIHSVWGQRIGGEPELIARGVTLDRAGELEWQKKYHYDRITIKAA